MTGICVIGLYISYAIPIYLRLTNPDFQVGPWNLKGYHKLVGWTSLVWIGVDHGAVLRPAVLAVLADLGRQEPSSSMTAPATVSTTRTTSTSPGR